MTGTLRYISHADIDKKKYDRCIATSPNGLIYAFSFYLDTMATNWDLLVAGDYEMVMPLPWRKKYGLHYLYQPFLCAQLGVFGKKVNGEMVESFLKAIPNKFRLWDISLNQGNLFPVEGFDLYERTNFILDLHPSYEALYTSYRENIRRNIKKSVDAGCTTDKGFSPSQVISLAAAYNTDKNIDWKKQGPLIEELYRQLHSEDKAMTFGIRDGKHELLASCIFFFSHQRAYYILVGNHPNGRTLGASHVLIDFFIKENAGKDLVLDFEGSDLRNLAFFYSSFGAREEKYPGLKRNTLPGIVRWLKKM
jgi:hypothetical protein